MVEQVNPVEVAEANSWKIIRVVNKYVVIQLVIQYCLLYCLPYDRFSNIVIYEGQALSIQQVTTFLPDT